MDKLHTGKTKTHEVKTEVSEMKATKHGRRFMRRRSWKDMSPVQKVGNVLIGAVELVLVTHKSPPMLRGLHLTDFRFHLIGLRLACMKLIHFQPPVAKRLPYRRVVSLAAAYFS